MMSRTPPWSAVVLLGLTQIIGYGTLYYSFSILAPGMSRDFQLSSETIFATLSVALLAGGLLAPSVGRWIDRIGAGRVMTLGSGIAAAALICCALVPGRVSFAASLVVLECAATFVQYGAAFALLVQIRPEMAQRSITYLTLIAGFASTLFWPITTWLYARMSWQDVYLIFGLLNAGVCLPIHLYLSSLSGRETAGSEGLPGPAKVSGSLSDASRRTGLVLMITAFSIQSLLSSAILVHMVPILSGLGLGASAALVGSLFGPSQVVSRFTNMMLGGNLPPLKLGLIAAALMPLAIGILAISSGSIAGAVVFAIVFGLGNGIFSIVTGTLPLALFGNEGYGRLQGSVMATRLIVSAAAPFTLALSIELMGVLTSLLVTAMVGCIAVVSLLAVGAMARRQQALVAADHLPPPVSDINPDHA